MYKIYAGAILTHLQDAICGKIRAENVAAFTTEFKTLRQILHFAG